VSILDKKMRFVKIFGYTLIILFVGCLFTLGIYSSIEKRSLYYNYFGIALSLWYLITGIGILIRQKWGYYLFKFFLYVLLLAFPIGTIISYKSLAYIKEKDIKYLFCQ
jgi:hypothetical protein